MDHSFDIAIIAMAGRFPGARDVEAFWQNLSAGAETISFFSADELQAEGIGREILSHPFYVRAKGILEDADCLDAGFFGYSSLGASLMDPQQRVSLECAWEVLERAGYTPYTYPGRIGIYAGASINTYLLSGLFSQKELLELVDLTMSVAESSIDDLAGRIAHSLNLRGPALTVQTNCSTSLVATHLACQSLLNFECDMALAGGVAISFPHKSGYLYQQFGILSPDGHCRALSSDAQGTVEGEGVGFVLLKRLQDAIDDHDTICALIKGSAINNDGATKVGYTAPSVEGQAAVIMEAMAMANLPPEAISYVETHGTGTMLGDQVEITALLEAFRTGAPRQGSCAIGSVKTNIGHLDAAAGVAGLIKTVLMLMHRRLVPSLHCARAHPALAQTANPFYVNATFCEWKESNAKRRAGVSSFGIGGTNAHILLEEAPLVRRATLARPWHLLCLSARSKQALEAATTGLIAHLRQQPDIRMTDVASTLQRGRSAFDYRLIAVCQDRSDSITALASRALTNACTDQQREQTTGVAFLFPDYATQYINMARELYRADPGFRAQADRCCDILRSYITYDLHELLSSGEITDEANSKAQDTKTAQCTLFVIEYALAQLWMRWGIRPRAMLGHGLGEYVAACLAGVFSLEDALRLVATRGHLLQQLPSGAMLSVSCSASSAGALLSDELALAAINGEDQCILSGTHLAIKEAKQYLAASAVEYRDVQATRALHSHMMEPMLSAFRDCLAQIMLRPPQIPYISNLTGTWVKAEDATDPDYWAQHVRQTVRFSEGLSLLMGEKLALLEVGPGRMLSSLATSHSRATETHLILASLPGERDRKTCHEFILTVLGQLWLHGIEPDWQQLYAGEQPYRIPLPTYPFEHQRYWIGQSAELVHRHRQLSDRTDLSGEARMRIPTGEPEKGGRN